MVRLHTKNWLYRLPGSASTVCVGGWWWLRANLVIDFGYSLALAKPNNFIMLRNSYSQMNKQYLSPSKVLRKDSASICSLFDMVQKR